jgi:hypothetical protein
MERSLNLLGDEQYAFGDYVVYLNGNGKYSVDDTTTGETVLEDIEFSSCVDSIHAFEKENPNYMNLKEEIIKEDVELQKMNDITIAARKLMKAAKSNNQSLGNMSAIVLNLAFQLKQHEEQN